MRPSRLELASAFVVASTACVARPDPAPAHGAAPAKAQTGPTITNFLKIRVPGSVWLAPDGSVYCRDFPDGINQLYKRDPGASVNSAMKKLTEFKDGLAGYSASPDGKTIIL